MKYSSPIHLIHVGPDSNAVAISPMHSLVSSCIQSLMSDVRLWFELLALKLCPSAHAIQNPQPLPAD
jgi:hypothetical protein